ncbi:MAG TPA: carboxypeptidase-like regulatory domain-containing protein, partial [Chitinophagaceae bacterium]|nr:carboxypeptidase-like regulatory domain-containing protein [Chitinophagaceae bacterium]
MKHCLPKREINSSSGCSICDHSGKLRFLFFITLFFCSGAIFAQNTVTGKVATGDTALANVTVQVKGSPTATQTNSSGNFAIDAPGNATLVFTSIGYTTQ